MEAHSIPFLARRTVPFGEVVKMSPAWSGDYIQNSFVLNSYGDIKWKMNRGTTILLCSIYKRDNRRVYEVSTCMDKRAPISHKFYRSYTIEEKRQAGNDTAEAVG